MSVATDTQGIMFDRNTSQTRVQVTWYIGLLLAVTGIWYAVELSFAWSCSTLWCKLMHLAGETDEHFGVFVGAWQVRTAIALALVVPFLTAVISGLLWTRCRSFLSGCLCLFASMFCAGIAQAALLFDAFVSLTWVLYR
jgi:hypothetical protein